MINYLVSCDFSEFIQKLRMPPERKGKSRGNSSKGEGQIEKAPAQDCGGASPPQPGKTIQKAFILPSDRSRQLR